MIYHASETRPPVKYTIRVWFLYVLVYTFDIITVAYTSCVDVEMELKWWLKLARIMGDREP